MFHMHFGGTAPYAAFDPKAQAVAAHCNVVAAFLDVFFAPADYRRADDVAVVVVADDDPSALDQTRRRVLAAEGNAVVGQKLLGHRPNLFRCIAEHDPAVVA